MAQRLFLDNNFTSFVLKDNNFFKNIHPNSITIAGFICNIFLWFSITQQLLISTALILFVRYTCDLLDGGVARKYNKVSDLGGFLDSVSDNALIFVLVSSIGYLLELNYYFELAAVITIVNAGYMISQHSFINHEPIKQGTGIFKGTYSFFVNNNCISYTLTYLGLLLI